MSNKSVRTSIVVMFGHPPLRGNNLFHALTDAPIIPLRASFVNFSALRCMFGAAGNSLPTDLKKHARRGVLLLCFSVQSKSQGKGSPVSPVSSGGAGSGAGSGVGSGSGVGVGSGAGWPGAGL